MKAGTGFSVSEVCSAGCIGCRRCEKTCPVKAITVTDNLAVFDYKLCDNKGACFGVCPTKSIGFKQNHVWGRRG